jgi:RNA polymerase sigma-70 factor (ECF subfamily)
MTMLSDTDLFEDVRLGTANAAAAFTELYRRHQQWTYAYCLKVIGREDDAKDVFQETFVRFYRSAPTCKEPVANVPGLIMRIARNLCLNHRRDRKETVEIEEMHLVVDAHHQYEHDELLELIQAALACLDVEYREVFVMRLYQDMPYDEIAELTGQSVSAVKTKVWRAKQRIQDLLAPVLAEFERL